jgi:23S rRNA U2552 (ribose-2'-O)-methylase RlmE/FtsJ
MSFYLIPSIDIIDIHTIISIKYYNNDIKFNEYITNKIENNTILINESNECDNKNIININTNTADRNNCNNNSYNNITNVIINDTLYSYLTSIKLQLDKYNNKWDIYKKYTNTYEYIHSVIPNTKQSVSKLKPLSRSYYKMIEIIKTHNIFNDSDEIISNNINYNNSNDKIKTFHLAEGPGGFIEAIVNVRNNKNDIYYGMTLKNNNDINIPGWKSSLYFLNNNKNVIIENSFDNDGNLMSKNNLLYCYSKYKGMIDIVTGDGGFDFSIDFNKQELLSFKLILCQVIFNIAIQKINGWFILKVFDLFTQPSIDLLYILSSIYDKVYISKPNSSRCANSEKYIICKNFKISELNRDLLLNELINVYDIINNNNLFIKSLLNIDIPYYFLNKIEEINAIFGQQQIENISLTISLLETNKQDKIENMKKNNILKCISWCQKHKIPHNKTIQTVNIFLSNNSKK